MKTERYPNHYFSAINHVALGPTNSPYPNPITSTLNYLLLCVVGGKAQNVDKVRAELLRKDPKYMIHEPGKFIA